MRHVWITGAGRGIGAAIAHAFAREGAALSLSGRNLQTLESQAAELRKAFPGVKLHLSVMDLSDPASVEAAHRANHAAWGPVTVLINNAGQALSQPFAKTDLQLWQHMLNVNLTGTYLCIQAALPDLLAESAKGHAARIVNIASTAGLKGFAYVSAYAAAKHGVIGLTRSLALELARKRLAFKALKPSWQRVRPSSKQSKPASRLFTINSFSSSPIRSKLRNSWRTLRKALVRCLVQRRPPIRLWVVSLTAA